MCDDTNIDCNNPNDQFFQTLSQCPVLTESDTVHIGELEDWLSNVASIFMASFGVVGNVLLIIIIFKLQRLREDVYQILLISLLVGDTTCLLLQIMGTTKETISNVMNGPSSELYASSTDLFFFDVIFHSFQRFAISFSTFMTVGITLERFIMVHTPLSHHAPNSRAIIRSALKILIPTFLISILNASPTIIESRLFDWLSNSQLNLTDISGSSEAQTIETLHSKALPYDDTFNSMINSNDSGIGTAIDEPISTKFQELVNEYLIFKIIQVFALTLIPSGLLIYYNLRIFHGVIERQRLLIPRERIFNQKLKEKKKGKKKEYDLEATIEEWQKTAEETINHLQKSNEDNAPFNTVKFYPTIGTFKHTTDLLTLPVTLPGIDIEAKHLDTQRSSINSLGASNKRQYEDKLAFDNMMMSVIFLMLRIPSITTGIHKVFTSLWVRDCLLLSQFAYPYWAQILGIVGDFTVTLSLSTRSLGYIILNATYYLYAKKIMTCGRI